MEIDTVGEQQHGELLRVLLKVKDSYNPLSMERDSWTSVGTRNPPAVFLEPIPGGEGNAPSWQQIREAKRRAQHHWEVCMSNA